MAPGGQRPDRSLREMAMDMTLCKLTTAGPDAAGLPLIPARFFSYPIRECGRRQQR